MILRSQDCLRDAQNDQLDNELQFRFLCPASSWRGLCESEVLASYVDEVGRVGLCTESLIMTPSNVKVLTPRVCRRAVPFLSQLLKVLRSASMTSGIRTYESTVTRACTSAAHKCPRLDSLDFRTFKPDNHQSWHSKHHQRTSSLAAAPVALVERCHACFLKQAITCLSSMLMKTSSGIPHNHT